MTNTNPLQDGTAEPVRRRGRRSAGDTPGREALIRAALSAFAQRGFDGASLRMIAQAAQVDVALPARLFGGKEQMWEAVIDHLVQFYQQHYAERLGALVEQSQTDPAAALRGFIHCYADLCVENPAVTAFLMLEATNPGPRLQILMSRLIRPVMRQGLDIVERAQQAGCIRAIDPVLFLRMLASGLAIPLSAPDLLPERTRAAGNLPQRLVDEAIAIFLPDTLPDADAKTNAPTDTQ